MKLTDRVINARPKDGSAAAISESLSVMLNLKDEVEQGRAQAEAARGKLLVGATPAQIHANEALIIESDVAIAQIDALREALAEPLKAAVKSERLADLRKQFEDLKHEEAFQAFAKAWQQDYLPHAQAIAAILRLEVVAEQKMRLAYLLSKKIKEAGAEPPNISSPSMDAVGQLTTGSLHNNVSLPGILGAPFIPVRKWEEEETFVSEFKDWEGPMGCTDTGTPFPLRTKQVEQTRKVPRSAPIREDVPIWPEVAAR